MLNTGLVIALVRKLRRNRCPLCQSPGALVADNYEYGESIKCILCEWWGIIDDFGRSAGLDPPPLPKRRPQKRTEAVDSPDSVDVLPVESGLDKGTERDQP